MNEVKGKKIVVELLNGQKIFGVVHSWGKSKIWVVEDTETQPKDIPREIIQRAFVVFEGGKK